MKYMKITIHQKRQLNNITKKYHLNLLYLFGSQAKGAARTDSDFDIGYLPTDKFQNQDEQELVADLNKIFHRQIDICNLKTASPLLKMQIVKNGIFLAGERKARINFQVKAISSYLDTAFLRRLTYEYNRSQI